MKNNNLIDKILSESLETKANEITEKIKNKLKYNEFDYVEETELSEKDGEKMPKTNKKKMNKSNIIEKNKVKSYVDEEEMEEGNAFTGALAKAKKEGKDSFTVDGKTYPVKESVVYQINVDGELLSLSESEIVDLIEEIVIEQKTNLKGSGKPKGKVEYDRVHQKDEDINKKALKDVAKKMEDYVKPGSKAKFEMNPDYFPKGNGELGEMSKKAYRASDAVEEYITNFAYAPGMENLKFDEIDQNDDWATKNIEGSELTGNSPKYGNAVDTGLGKRINKKRKENWYQEEKSKSYNRVTQPVDNAGEGKKSGKLKNMFNKLGESVETENKEIINEEMSKMKHLFNYNKKTQ